MFLRYDIKGILDIISNFEGAVFDLHFIKFNKNMFMFYLFFYYLELQIKADGHCGDMSILFYCVLVSNLGSSLEALISALSSDGIICSILLSRKYKSFRKKAL